MDEISLIIKAPNQKFDDLKIDCQLSWTILDLKVYLCKEYPSKPNISDQRLIYSGHLLKDEQYLRDIVQSSDDSNTYTFHLVCPQRQATTANDQSSKTIADTGRNANTTTSDQQNAPPTSASSADLINAFRGTSSFSSDATNNFATNYTLPISNNLAIGNNAAIHESYNAMMSQYYQYMSYIHQVSSPSVMPDYASYFAIANAYRSLNSSSSLNPTLNATAGVSQNVAIGTLENQQQPAAVAAAVAANRNDNNLINNNDNNNQNAVENEEANRDWTEMLYSFSKAMVMFSIMYFYSSFGRLLLLITIALVLYLYKSTRFVRVQNLLRNNNNNNEQPNARNQAQINQEINNDNNNNEPVVVNENINDDLNAQDSDAANSNDIQNEIIPDNSRYTGLRFVWVFVSSLFTSLIPDPAPIN